MDKILLINKPAGITSFDVVRKCKKIFNEKKIGHTGTLDPEASGLLIVLMGKYTKYLPFCVKDNKRYIAEFKLGYISETLDIWGKDLKEVPYKELNEDDIVNIIPKFTGDIKQIPPMYSAIKHNGKKLYEYARNNIEIEREARDVHIEDLIINKIDDRTYHLEASVSSGTYIRSLINDIAKELGEEAVMSKLTRVAIEHISLDKAIDFEALNDEYEGISPLEVIDKQYERVEIDNVKNALNGLPMTLEGHFDRILLVNNNEAIAIYQKKGNQYYCKRGLF